MIAAIKTIWIKFRLLISKGKKIEGRNHTKGAGKTVVVKRYKGTIDVGLE